MGTSLLRFMQLPLQIVTIPKADVVKSLPLAIMTLFVIAEGFSKLDNQGQTIPGLYA